MTTGNKIFYVAAGLGAAGIFLFAIHNLRKKSLTAARSQKFIYPIASIITSPFGYRTHPVNGEADTFHNGIDLRGAAGAAIVAPMDGTAESLYSNATGGNQLILRHSNGMSTGYAHLSAYLVEKGQEVKQGQQIARVGATGRVTGPHLHFTVRNAAGDFIDPMEVLST